METRRNLASDPRLKPYYFILEQLTPAQRRAWAFVREYVSLYRRACFTYNELARFWREAETRINIETLSRRLRELSALGLLERREYRDQRGRRRTRFCLPDDLYEYILEVARRGW